MILKKLQLTNLKKLLMLMGIIFFTSVSAAEFWSIKFDTWVGEISTATIGRTISLPIYVKNLGRLQDNYTILLVSTSPNIDIETQSMTIKEVDYGEVKVAYGKIILLFVTDLPTNLGITVCSALYSQTCSPKKVLTIKSGMASLPDFDFYGIVQIMVLVSVLLLIYKKV